MVEPKAAQRDLSTVTLSEASRGHSAIAEDHAEMQMLSKSAFSTGVFEATIPADAVLAMAVEDAGEDEVIVNPHRLRGSSTPRLVDDQEMPDPVRRFELFLVALGRGLSRP
jgi:hypothetical protein